MKFRGSLRYGNSYPDAIGVPWPLAQLTVEKDALIISVPWRAFRFPREHISRLMKVTGKIAIGVQVEHTMFQHPNFITFWSYKFGDVKKGLDQNGYSFSTRS